MRILITGGAGFIGSHIQDAFLNLGHEIAILDNLITGRKENLNPKSKFYQLDICSPEVEKVFQEFKPEILCHHAAQMDVRKSVADPGYDAQVNVLGLINLLEAARKVGTQKVTFASSGGAMYGEQDTFPADEKHAVRPASPYGLTKAIGEEYLKLYERLYDISSVSLRYGNVYGPRQNPHGEAGVVAIFCEKILKGQAPTINGDGLQTRDYVFVEDVVKANIAAIQDSVKGSFNIGTGIETNVVQIAEILGKNEGIQAMHGPAKMGEQKRSVLNADLAKKELNWSPTWKVEEGLLKTLDWFRNRKNR